MSAAARKPVHVDPDTFILPHNLEAEQSCLGAAMVNARAAEFLVDRLRPEMFFRRVHQMVFEAIVALIERRSAVDLLTLRAELEARRKLEAVGPVYLAKLPDGVPSSTNVAHYADIVRDLYTRRAIAEYASVTIDMVASGTCNGPALLNDADRRLLELQGGHIETRMRSLGSGFAEMVDDLEWRCAHRGEVTGIPTGFASIDEQTSGWQRGDLVVIGARPSIGKTTMVVNAIGTAASAGYRCAMFSLEMKRRQVEFKFLASRAGVPVTRILGGHLDELAMRRISEAQCELHELPISIDDRSGVSVWDIRAACRRLKANEGLDLVVIDYAQLIPGSLERRGATRNEEVTDISRKLKVMADELGVAVILLSQLSRKARDRLDPRPQLSDLRESGALEQDADIVAFLHRKNHREGGLTYFIIEKQRMGPTGTLNLTLDRDISLFTDGGVEPEPAPPAEKKPKAKK